MANQTVYPYGTGGSLPSSVGIVNDLTTGGANKALSAEMGKVLNTEFESVAADLSREEAFPVTWTTGSYYTSTGATASSTSWERSQIDVEAYEGRVFRLRVFSVANSPAYCLVVDASNGILVSIHLDGTVIEQSITIPVGAKYLLLSNREAGGAGKLYLRLSVPVSELPDLLKWSSVYGRFGEWLRGAYWNASGQYVDSASDIYGALPRIDVSGMVGLSYIFNLALVSNGAAYVLFTDANDSILASYRPQAQIKGTIPANAKWLLVSNRFALPSGGSGVYQPAPFVIIKHAYSMPALEDIVGTRLRNNLAGKKISLIGDSIVYGNGASSTAKRFSTLLCSYYDAVENNLGVAGSCLSSNCYNTDNSTRFVTRATAESLAGSDLIIVFGGTNDLTKDSKPIGELFVETDITPTGRIGDKQIGAPSDTDAFAGAVHELINTIRTNAPGVPVMFMTPINRGQFTATSPTAKQRNVNGNYLYQFCDAIRTICSFYDIPVLDMGKSGLDFSNTAIANLYSADALHPNDAGHERIAKIAFRFIEDNIILD